MAHDGSAFARHGDSDLFLWHGERTGLPAHYTVHIRYGRGTLEERVDPYSFGPLLDPGVLQAFGAGGHSTAHRFLGAHAMVVDGVAGTRFAVWAPDAERVSVVMDQNQWDGRCLPARVRGATGVWELFVPGVGAGTLYKFEIRNRHDGSISLKADPFGRAQELRPRTASIVPAPPDYAWGDDAWLRARARWEWWHAPVSIYEVHLGSWRRRADGSVASYRDCAHQLVEYATALGFTHVELMPITEYPLDESWGYQPTGYFAPTGRHGSADDLRYLIDCCHRAGIGVLLDWVPGHFPRDAHGLARFDGSALYEYADPRQGSHPDWGTLVFNYGRHEVCSFLLSSARYWLEEFHFDGLRVDAVASMLYLDYSRRPGEWLPNQHGGNENLDAIAFLQALNRMTHQEFPGSLTIAEESTAWPGVSRPVHHGGLGFSMKWNMGWMHDTLEYFRRDPVYRRHHHNLLTFGPVYAFTENFVLPLSHDEVVHLKGSLLGRMPGDDWQRFANLRLLLAWQWAYPGKKLLFMGGELAQPGEWNHREELPWALLGDPRHGGVQRLVGDLNRLYQTLTPLHRHDFSGDGFSWLRWDDADNSLLAWLRRAGEEAVVVVANCTPVPRPGYRIGVPGPGRWREVLNTDSRFYGGSDLGNPLPLPAEPVPWMGQPWSVVVAAPPLALVILAPE
jgi:1,4-alpha-glucan branching enzyme